MNLTCPRESLLDAVQLVSPAVAARTTKPILAGVKVAAADDGTMTLTANDTEVAIRHTIQGAAVTAPGAVIVPAKELVSILSAASDEPVSLTTTDTGVLVRTGTRGRFSLNTYPVDEFPDVPAFDGEAPSHELTAGVLRALVKRTAFAADKKDSGGRFSLTGVLWAKEGGVVRLVATDTKRLAVCEGEATGDDSDTKVSHLIPTKAITLLERSLVDDGEAVRVTLRPNEAQFRTERSMVYTRLIEGRFPPYREVLAQAKKQATAVITLPRVEFFARVRQAAILTDDESRRVDMVFGGGRVLMTTRGAPAGASEVEMELADYDGPEKAVAFDPAYVVDFLKNVADDAVVLRMSDGSKSALFEAGERTLCLIMPLADR